jgi:hypothetical protein
LIGGAAGAPQRIVSSAMVKEAVAGFAAKASLAGRFGALPPEQRVRLARVYLMGAAGLSLPADPSAYLREPLLASLLAFAAQGGGGGARLFGFGEFEPALRPQMALALLEAGDAGECPPPPPPCPWRPLNDVAVVCSLAAQGLLARNAHGGLARPALTALKRLVNDPTLSGRSVPDGAPGHPSGFLVGYCLKEALIVDAGGGYAPNKHCVSAWLERGMKDRLHRLNAYAEEFLEGMGLDLARELLLRAGGRAVAVSKILPEADRPHFSRALGVLGFLGRAHAWHSHGEERFAPCPPAEEDADALYAKEPKRGIVAMPDFSVIIPQEASPAEIFEFSKIGILCSFDKVYNGRITKESVSNALCAGAGADALNGWLRGRNAAANVASTVDEWIREFGRLYVSGGAILAARDETVARQLAELEPLRKHIARVDAHTVFIISPGSERKVSEMLEKLGFDTRVPGGCGAARAEAAAADAQTGGAAPPAAKPFTPLTDFGADQKPPPPQRLSAAMSRTKYGTGLKALEQSEMIHVVDYAMLTNQALVIDYDGSACIKRDVYTVVPLGLDKGLDAAVEAEIPFVRGRKQFYLDKIKRIAVVAQ